MSAPLFPIRELLALPPDQLAGLVDACPGDYVSSRAAVLGLDLDVPEHYRALCAAFPEAFSGLDGPVPPAGVGVRSDLTPESEPGPDPDTGEGTAPEPAQSAAQPAGSEPLEIAAMLAEYRGRPDPFLFGTFAMYSAPDGSIVIVTEIPGRGVEQHQIPGRFVALGLNAMNGKGAMLGKLFGR